MKKILIVSDSHGNIDNFLSTIEKEKPDYKIHAGDFIVPISVIEENFDWFVRGNNDYQGPKEQEFKIQNLNIVLTHGDDFGYGLWGGIDKLNTKIFNYAKSKSANVIITGHTHVENFKIIDGIFLLNPGSISLPRNANLIKSYMIIHIGENGILEKSLEEAVRYLD
ncbi:MAG: YfcE family phosphodiesterase [Malacoplasma sp.]|nr:YfcE family phosphodiesterase [Malacoplasma sp.]